MTISEVVLGLVDEDEDYLIEELGSRISVIERNFGRAGDFATDFPRDGLGLGADDVRVLGLKVLTRLQRELHAVFCGSSKSDFADRKKLADAAGIGEAILAGALVTVLTGSFGVAPAIAAVVAALLIKRIFRPAGEEICVFWTEKLAERD